MGKSQKKSVVACDQMITEDAFKAWASASGHEYTHLFVEDDGELSGVTMATEEGREAYWQWLCSQGDEYEI